MTLVSALRVWAEMIKIEHSIFALPFAIISVFLAARHLEGRMWPYAGQLGLVVLCMVAARSVAMTFNRIVDADLDAKNPRTSRRPIPTGRLSLGAAWLMLLLSAITFGLGSLGFHVFYGNTWPILLSGPVLIYLCGYSLTKRFTRWSHLYLGSAVALAPVAAWLAIHPQSLGWPAVILFCSVTCWIAGFDILYACQDIEIDRRDGLHSLPARLGPRKALWIARCAHALVVAGLITLGAITGMGLIFGIGVAIVAVLLIVENAMVRPDDFSKVNLAFFTMNGIVGIVLAIATISDLLMHPAA